MEAFGPATRAWFERSFAAPTLVQARGWASIARGAHSLLVAPTGSGKTLAAFLSCLDRLLHAPPVTPGVRVLYVSPLKALVYDVERNLRAPLRGIAQAAEGLELAHAMPRVAIRTGDTTTKERVDQAKHPAEILVTTPESLFLMLASAVRETLTSIDTIIVDEVHAIAPSKRGAHLALSLERLVALTGREPQRIGLSATARPLDAVAAWLGGDREVDVVDCGAMPAMDVRIVVPVPDMTRPDVGVKKTGDEVARALDLAQSGGKKKAAKKEARAGSVLAPAPAPPGLGEPTDHSIWPAVYPRLLSLIAEARTTIVFVNSRGLCERLAQRLNELAGAPLVRAHHGSLAHAQRTEIEESLKRGDIRGIVATSSLELGIDMGTVDMVVLVESPGAVSRGIQRIGRAGHGVGETSHGRLFPKHRGDLLESAVVVRRMREGEIESLAVPKNALDVLAQQVVAMCGTGEWSVAELGKVVRRAASYRQLPEDALVGVLDMLAGRYPSHAFADLRPRLVWDRATGQLEPRKGALKIAIANAGTIPDRGLFGVHLGEFGPRVGELDEEMVHESAPGQTITLGASTWRIERITRDRVIVVPAPGESGRLPFWRGDGPGRPLELGRAIGAFTRELLGRGEEDGLAWLQREYDLDAWAAANLWAYVSEQQESGGAVPTDRTIVVERFRDEIGDWRICILTPFGARVHAPWALAIQAELAARFEFEVQALWSDDGIALRLVDVDEIPDLDLLLPDPDDARERIVEQLAHSALFAGQFRENAGRALLLPRRRPGARTPLWAQRQRSQQLLAVAREHPSFPIVIETYRACLQDVFDVPALVELLRAIRSREIRVEQVETTSPSPFARSLVFAYVAAYMYEGDLPLAERRAQALALDRKLLHELLGNEELAELLDPGAIDEIEAELQGLAEGHRARDVDELHDLLRRVGELEPDEIAARCEDDPTAWIEALVAARRAVWMQVGGRRCLVAIEDVAAYRDALGCTPPPGLPHAWLGTVDLALDGLVLRWYRTHGPHPLDVPAGRWQVAASVLEPPAARMVAAQTLVRGALRPGTTTPSVCHADVLRRIKRRSLAKLRNEIAAVDTTALARFVPAWQGIADGKRTPLRLEEVVPVLEGLPLPYSELERAILPARIPGFAPRMLDDLGASGLVCWVGHGALGRGDGRIALYRRDRVGLVLEPPVEPADLDEVHRAILDHLKARGASFLVELARAAGEGVKLAALEESLLDLVWAGLVTNDTFLPLRALAAGPGKRGAGPRMGGGRWSLVADLVGTAASATERAHARATMLLARWGVVTRDVVGVEVLPGGFAPIQRVLREMEDVGKVRRGYFIEGLGGAQFAAPGAVDRLRSLRPDDHGDVLVLATTDPANVWGALVPWPARDGASSGARRTAGSVVVLVDGVPVLWLERGAKRIVTFPAADDARTFELAAKALPRIAETRRGKALRVETIDGEPARGSRFAEALRAADFHADVRGLSLEV